MRSTRLIAAASVVAVLTAGCAAPSDESATTTQSADAVASQAVVGTAEVDVVDESDDLAPDAVVASVTGETVELGDEQLIIDQGGTYTLTGSSSSSVVVDTDEAVVLVLDGVDIASATGAAIVVEQADDVTIELAAGSENRLEDASTRTDDEINAVLYSESDLTITGTGSLTVVANDEDGIATKDDLEILSGTIVVTAADDGIRGRDSITIVDGVISVVSGGDGLTTTNQEEADRGNVHIVGGTITVDAGDDAIKAQTIMVVDGGTIVVDDSLEGLEATNITINAGDISIYATDDGINAVAGQAGLDVFIEVNGGTIDVEVGSGDTDAFDSNGDLTINGGDITVTAPTSSFDADGTAVMQGGTLVVNGEQLTTIPQSRMGGGGGGGGGGGRP